MRTLATIVILAVAAGAFAAPGVRAYAASAYDALGSALGDGAALPPFDDAFAGVLRFVAMLDLPA